MKFIKFCVSTCDMTKISYFGKPNSTLGSGVPLAMFVNFTKGWFLRRVLQLKRESSPAKKEVDFCVSSALFRNQGFERFKLMKRIG